MLRARQDLREAVLDLMRSLERCAVTDEALADEIARLADGDAGDLVIKTALRAIARNHRIRALEGRARLAGLCDAHGHPVDPG